MKKFIISILILGGSIMAIGSSMVQVKAEKWQDDTEYSFRVVVDNDRPSKGQKIQKKSKSKQAINNNTSIKNGDGTESSAKLWSRVVTLDGKEATNEDFFTSGGKSEMTYKSQEENWNGHKLELQVRSGNNISAVVDIQGNWEADK